MIVRTENAIIDMNKVDAVILHEMMNQLMFMCGNNIIRVNYPIGQRSYFDLYCRS